MKKRIIGILLMVCLALQAQCAWAVTSENMRLMYAADGRELYVAEDEVEAYKQVGWYTAPPVWMYAADGRQLLVSGDEIAAFQEVGWYLQPPVLMYAGDGRTLYVSGDEVEAYQNVGWYLEPVCTVYAPYDRTFVVPTWQVQAYVDVGWYTTFDEALYNEVVPVIKQAMADGDYNLAVNQCDYALNRFQEYGTVFYDDIWGNRYAAMDAWRASVRQPVVVLSSYVTESNGTETAVLTLKNISYKTVAAIELEFNCYDVFMDPVRYYGSGSSLCRCTAKDMYLFTLGTQTWNWKLYGYNDAEYVRNIYITRVAFTDGTVWER